MSGYGSWQALGRRSADDQARLSTDLARRLWPFIRPHTRFAVVMMATILVTAGLSATPPLLYRAIIDRTIPDARLALLTGLALAIIVVAILNTTVQVITRWATSQLGERVIYDLRTGLFDHLQKMPFAFFTHAATGATVNRLTSDLAGGHRAFTSTLASFIETVVGVVVTVTVMLALDIRLTLLSLAIAPIFVLLVRRGRGYLHHLMDARLTADADLSNWLNERFDVGGAMLARLLGRRTREGGDFADRAAQVRDIGVATAVSSRLFHAGFALVAAVGTGLVYWIGGRMVISGAVTLGTIVAFAAYLSQLYGPLTMLANARVDLATALVSFQRAMEVLDFAPPVPETTDPVTLTDPAGRITFAGVSFSYPRSGSTAPPTLAGGGVAALGHDDPDEDGQAPRNLALDDVSFTVEPGTRVALVGPSGAGKTTSTLLVTGLYRPDEGAVQLDGHDITALSEDTRRRGIGMVTQDIHLFHASVADNLRYANADATDDELIEAATAAHLHELLASLPDGYNTLVGERGYRFSGGEKQRLAIARLLLQDPAVVVLDEATAHLDSEAERDIQVALDRALAGRSSLIIAHRLSTVISADELVVLDHGRVVERGTHDQLLAAGGLYERLCRIQFGAPNPNGAADTPLGRAVPAPTGPPERAATTWRL